MILCKKNSLTLAPPPPPQKKKCIFRFGFFVKQSLSQPHHSHLNPLPPPSPPPSQKKKKKYIYSFLDLDSL